MSTKEAYTKLGRMPSSDKIKGFKTTKYSIKEIDELMADGECSKNQDKWDFPNMMEGNDIIIRFHVPSTEKKHKIIGDAAFRKRIAEAMGFFSYLFGGGTQFKGIGTWKDDNRNLTEPIGVIETSTDTVKWKKLDLVVERWIKEKKTNWGQDSVTLVINNRLFFI